jgi:hypothetical protein
MFKVLLLAEVISVQPEKFEEDLIGYRKIEQRL